MIINKLLNNYIYIFYETITFFGFKKYTINQYIYLKAKRTKFIILVLYMNDILLANSNLSLLFKIKIFLIKNFNMVNMNETNYVIGI